VATYATFWESCGEPSRFAGENRQNSYFTIFMCIIMLLWIRPAANIAAQHVNGVSTAAQQDFDHDTKNSKQHYVFYFLCDRPAEPT
jgi:hypothetical protein